jgi:peptide/nickel transport system substrate-binding protein
MRRAVFGFLSFFTLFAMARVWGEELKFYVYSDPKTFNPAMVADDSSDTVRYLTGGVLLRLNRETQNLQPELAVAWAVSKDGRTITFTLRRGVHFSDGTPFSAQDVKYTMEQLMDPALHSPTGDSFRSSQGKVVATVLAPDKIAISFPGPVAGLPRLFDEVAIVSAQSPKKEMATLGPFFVTEYKPGAYVDLRRNPNYWKHDSSGRQLPYLDGVKLEIQANRDIEFIKFSRNEIQLINSMDADYFDRLSHLAPGKVHDAGPSLDSEQIWFNQVPNAPIASYKREWFKSRNFRLAISSAINRSDLCRVVYKGHASAALGPVSPANKFWFDARLQPVPLDTRKSLQLLAKDGFHLSGGKLYDRAGHAVEFSIVTNAGNRARAAMATMVQQDLRAIGVTANVVTLDFPSLIQRITSSYNYEAALLGLVDVELDPNAQMNVWLSSSEEHQWNPKQETPATTWEAEIDRLMRAQASSMDDRKRKQSFDRVQEIVADEAPFIYLVNKDALTAVSPSVEGARPVPLRPQTFWNIEYLKLSDQGAAHGR